MAFMGVLVSKRVNYQSYCWTCTTADRDAVISVLYPTVISGSHSIWREILATAGLELVKLRLEVISALAPSE